MIYNTANTIAIDVNNDKELLEYITMYSETYKDSLPTIVRYNLTYHAMQHAGELTSIIKYFSGWFIEVTDEETERKNMYQLLDILMHLSDLS